nr:MAG TPA: hypothetical protein [Crassvirales sp.]
MLNAALITGIIRALIVLIALETKAALISRPTRSSPFTGCECGNIGNNVKIGRNVYIVITTLYNIIIMLTFMLWSFIICIYTIYYI